MRIDESDINDLRNYICIHLESIKQKFQADLIAKHHFVTHYPAIIHAMGPLNAMSMMRYESKHKTLKGFVNQTNNYTNLTKTIVTKHQQMISSVNNSYTDKFKNGELFEVEEIFLKDHMKLLAKNFKCSEKIYETKLLEHNIFDYRVGQFIFTQNCMFQIEKMLVVSSKYYFLCTQFEFIEYNKFLNSIKIQKTAPIQYSVVKFSNLDIKAVYEKQVVEEEFYIILDTLDLKICLKNCQ